MNNTNFNFMTNNNVNFEICQIDQLFEIGASKSIGFDMEYTQIISLVLLSIVGVFSMLYGALCPFFNNETSYTSTEKVKIIKPPKPSFYGHNEDEINEDINGNAVNAMFGVDAESDDDSDDNIEAIKATNNMSDDLDIEKGKIMQIISSIVGILSILYGSICHYFKAPGFTLHFVGIGRPSNITKSEYKLFDNINTENTMITIKSKLKENDTISSLKKLIRKTYSISTPNDILILYSHHIISNDELELKDVGISNNSLLTLAICQSDKIVPPPKEAEPEQKIQTAPEPEIEYESESESDDNGDAVNTMFGMYSDYESDIEPVNSVNELFAMFQDYDDGGDDEEFIVKEATPPPPTWPRPGFDIITQEDGVLVHKMPKCGHEMNKDSLYQYALSTFSDSRNIHLKCPHSRHQCSNTLCDTKWEYSSIIDILQYDDDDDINDESKNEKVETIKPLKPSFEDDESEYDSDDNIEAIKAINHMFDDDEPDLEDVDGEKEENIQIISWIVGTFSMFYGLLCDYFKVDASENDNKWMKYGKIELLSSRNVVENECDVQKCPRCNTLYFKNYNPDKTSLDNIKTVEDIEKEFKFQCIFCSSGSKEIVENIKIVHPPKEAEQSDDEEDIDGDAVNAMFGGDDESDDDSDDEIAEAMEAINNLFDDDEPDFEEKISIESLNEFCWCCGSKWFDGHICDSSFKRDLVEILSNAETQKIGSVSDVPSIRCCPSCCQLLFHIDCCKHMQCRNCKTDFCFVCLKPKQNGKWQCGSHSAICPVADRQNMETLPDTIVITKKSFKLF